MQENIKYVSKDALQYTVNKIKEHISETYATKAEINDINTALDSINGEVV